ncbi:hypothetical protein BB561_001815 [Smittium simulii]|uniref:Uncharacterized protein n=1 Tax=Smittium simulii TaxID=133385 RepID=A0A2T9YSZ2_9FUNG|nr:hypothetical protein BB561_001815 [Smittium simulii]
MFKTIQKLLIAAKTSVFEINQKYEKADIELNISIQTLALNIFANKLILYGFLASDFIKLDGVAFLCSLLGSNYKSSDIVFFSSRILFLIVHNGAEIQNIVYSHYVPNLISQSILFLNNDIATANILSRFSPELATAEALKASYIIAMKYETHLKDDSSDKPNTTLNLFGNTLNIKDLHPFKSLLKTTLDFILLSNHQNRKEKLLDYALQFLFIIPIVLNQEYSDLWTPEPNNMLVVDSLLLNLETSLVTYANLDNKSASQLKVEDNLSFFTLVCILGRFVLASDQVKTHVYDFIFKKRNFSALPETGNSARAILTRIISLPFQSELSLAVGDFLYVTCDSNTGKVIEMLGFGNTIGYFKTRNLFLSINLDEITEKYGQNHLTGVNFNPVIGAEETSTGLDKALEDMTDEEKEKEAERLFVLFDKLNKTGIIKVEPQFAENSFKKE